MSIAITSTKATLVRNALRDYPDATSSQLAKLAGCGPEYARAALRRAKLATVYQSGKTKGGAPRRKA